MSNAMKFREKIQTPREYLFAFLSYWFHKKRRATHKAVPIMLKLERPRINSKNFKFVQKDEENNCYRQNSTVHMQDRWLLFF